MPSSTKSSSVFAIFTPAKFFPDAKRCLAGQGPVFNQDKFRGIQSLKVPAANPAAATYMAPMASTVHAQAKHFAKPALVIAPAKARSSQSRHSSYIKLSKRSYNASFSARAL